ncbi:sulfate/thiosulfate import ATP-binding protein CysA [Pasteurella multocida subsp. multocida OH4807]|nr:sulfate/thiosulfate import ATP-binding protein CysA [Pasteurella multocida subsp. multocida OH4807]
MLSISHLCAGILNQVNLQISKGECVAIVGQSGSGKTTLLNAIAGYIDYQGDITLAQHSMQTVPPWQRNCRYLNQRLYLFPHQTIAGNLSLASPTTCRTEQLALLHKLKIAHLIDRYPHQLSGGEQQRAALARALIRPPHLLLLDEPFSSLDWETRRHIWSMLKQLIQEYEMTTLFVTHEPKEAAYLAHRQIHLHQGKLV